MARYTSHGITVLRNLLFVCRSSSICRWHSIVHLLPNTWILRQYSTPTRLQNIDLVCQCIYIFVRKFKTNKSVRSKCFYDAPDLRLVEKSKVTQNHANAVLYMRAIQCRLMPVLLLARSRWIRYRISQFTVTNASTMVSQPSFLARLKDHFL